MLTSLEERAVRAIANTCHIDLLGWGGAQAGETSSKEGFVQWKALPVALITGFMFDAQFPG